MHGISRMLILIPTLIFSISNPKSVFEQKLKLSVLPENWQIVSWRCWFRIQTYIFEILSTKLIFEILIPKSIFWQVWLKKAFPVYSHLRLYTLLLFLDIQLVLVLYFKIALHSSAFCCILQVFLKYEVPVYLFHHGYMMDTFSCVLVLVLSMFIFTSFCSILTNTGMTFFLISIRRINRRKHVN